MLYFHKLKVFWVVLNIARNGYLSLLIFFFLLFVFVFLDRVSLYSTGCPGTHSVDQAGLELRIRLPLPPKCWD